MSHLKGLFSSWTIAICTFFSSGSLQKSCSHKCHICIAFFLWLADTYNNISIHLTLLRTAIVTYVTFECFIFFMNPCNMFIYAKRTVYFSLIYAALLRTNMVTKYHIWIMKDFYWDLTRWVGSIVRYSTELKD